ncbi:MAG: FliH/SctL family protein, partial [Oleibacter sp.]|nr:FliH/SctL family protein [Thalassolituus sp.]
VDAEVTRLQQIIDNLNSVIEQRDQALPEVLTGLVVGVCEQVVAHELRTGAESINQFVHAAIKAMPEGEKAQRIWLSQADMALFQSTLSNELTNMPVAVADDLTAGECRVESVHSLAEFSARDHLNTLLNDLAMTLLSTSEADQLLSQESADSVAENMDSTPEPTTFSHVNADTNTQANNTNTQANNTNTQANNTNTQANNHTNTQANNYNNTDPNSSGNDHA